MQGGLRMPTDGLGGLFGTLCRALSEAILGGRTRRARALKALADRKFAELEQTHGLFIQLLEQLHKTTISAVEKLSVTDDVDAVLKTILDDIDAVEQTRRMGIDTRVHHYVEAKVYATKALTDVGVLKILDDELAASLVNVMSAYTRYFQVDSEYAHELGHALVGARSSLALHPSTRQRISLTNAQLRKGARNATEVVGAAIVGSRRRWSEFSERYHEFMFQLDQRNLL
jgi:hypothetical protein